MRESLRRMTDGFCGALAVLAVGASPASAQSKVWVVAEAPGSGVDFQTISAAVAAASDGDTILVQDGTYDPTGFAVDGKALSIVTAPSGATITGPVAIRDLAPGQTVVFQNLEVNHDVDLVDNQGAVWLQGCELAGSSEFEQGGTALTVTNCASVTVSECTLDGGNGFGLAGFEGKGGNGLEAVVSQVWIFDSVLEFGHGDCPDGAPPCGDKYHGLGARVVGGELFAEGSSFSGKSSLVAGHGSTSWLLECSLLDTLGDPLDPKLSGGVVFPIAGNERDLAVDSPAGESTPSSLSLTGLAGDTAFLLAGPGVGQVFLPPKFHGPLLVAGAPLLVIPLGVVPTGSVLTVRGDYPDLPAGTDALTIVLQAAFVDGSGTMWLADPAPLLLLDSAF